MFSNFYFDENRTFGLLLCLDNYSWKVSPDGVNTRPKHDMYSHGADCLRQIAQFKYAIGNEQTQVNDKAVADYYQNKQGRRR